MSEEKAEYMNSPVDELKPCPFCGSKDIDERGWLSGDGGAGPQCMNCGATAEPQWWNTRAESADSVEEAGQSRSTPPPVAGGEPVKKCAFPNCACDMRVICQMAYSALQHQDCVVISRECAESALNDVIYNIAEYRLRKSEGNWGEAAEKALENYCKYEAELKQSLERKNGQ